MIFAGITGVSTAEYVSPDTRLGYVLIAFCAAFAAVALWAFYGWARRYRTASELVDSQLPANPAPSIDAEFFAELSPVNSRFWSRKIIDGNDGAPLTVEEIAFELRAARPLKDVRVSLDVWAYIPNLSGKSRGRERVELSNANGRGFDLHQGEHQLLNVHARLLGGSKLSCWGSITQDEPKPASLKTRVGATYFVRLRVAHSNGPAITYPFKFTLYDDRVEVWEAYDDGEMVRSRQPELRKG